MVGENVEMDSDISKELTLSLLSSNPSHFGSAFLRIDFSLVCDTPHSVFKLFVEYFHSPGSLSVFRQLTNPWPVNLDLKGRMLLVIVKLLTKS